MFRAWLLVGWRVARVRKAGGLARRSGSAGVVHAEVAHAGAVTSSRRSGVVCEGGGWPDRLVGFDGGCGPPLVVAWPTGPVLHRGRPGFDIRSGGRAVPSRGGGGGRLDPRVLAASASSW